MTASTKITSEPIWVTTSPNPRTPATGHDAGQRGWRLHAIKSESKFALAACGLRPRYGWGLDLLINDKCARCERSLRSAAAAGSTSPDSKKSRTGSSRRKTMADQKHTT